ncbi:type II toxin-antitoxin system PemK/MazF family toxin [Candidatus Woesearchaeota archaeon]|nr:type II toxin-antitoxin system PemK/MazF family toxin [Candidatus Woesearchaeota archaeon]
MRPGNVLKSGDVVLVDVQFTDTFEIKKRPALVLFEELGNVVVVGITSNTSMKGVSLTKRDGVVKDSIIKLNYIFTISQAMIEKTLFSVSAEKRKEVFNVMIEKLNTLR